MPYIKSKDKEDLMHRPAQTAGELNFKLTMLIKSYMYECGTSYQTMNDIVGALDNCKDEFRRRIQHPYEDNKIQENGDVYYGE